jgi:hypothetical protein
MFFSSMSDQKFVDKSWNCILLACFFWLCGGQDMVLHRPLLSYGCDLLSQKVHFVGHFSPEHSSKKNQNQRVCISRSFKKGEEEDLLCTSNHSFPFPCHGPRPDTFWYSLWMPRTWQMRFLSCFAELWSSRSRFCFLPEMSRVHFWELRSERSPQWALFSADCRVRHDIPYQVVNLTNLFDLQVLLLGCALIL